MISDEVRLPVPGGDELMPGIAVDAHTANKERRFDPVLSERGQDTFVHLMTSDTGSTLRGRIIESEGDFRVRF